MILTTEILNNFKNVLKKENLKYTPQRISILEEVICGDGHRECEDIYLAIRQKGRAVSRATVYRTLDILVNNEFARKMDIGDGRIRYENKVNNPHHDHLVCTKCGIIVEFLNEEIEKIQDKVASKYNFKLLKHTHQLFGVCKKCQ